MKNEQRTIGAVAAHNGKASSERSGKGNINHGKELRKYSQDVAKAVYFGKRSVQQPPSVRERVQR
jgi:hypothetical protein